MTAIITPSWRALSSELLLDMAGRMFVCIAPNGCTSIELIHSAKLMPVNSAPLCSLTGHDQRQPAEHHRRRLDRMLVQSQQHPQAVAELEVDAVNGHMPNMRGQRVNEPRAGHLHERTDVDRKLIMCSMLGEGTKD